MLALHFIDPAFLLGQSGACGRSISRHVICFILLQKVTEFRVLCT